MQIVRCCSNLNYSVANKRQKMKETETERTESPVKDVVPNTIDTILNMEADISHREEEVGGKTVNIGELEVDLLWTWAYG